MASEGLRYPSNGRALGASQGILVAVFLVLMLSSPISSVSSCRLASGTITAWGIMLVGGAGGEVMWVVRSSISVIRRRE